MHVIHQPNSVALITDQHDQRYMPMVWREYGIPTWMAASYYPDPSDGDRQYVIRLFLGRNRKGPSILAEHADPGTFECLADCAQEEIAEQICLRRAREMCAQYYPKKPRRGKARVLWQEVNES